MNTPLTPTQIAKAKKLWAMFEPEARDMSFEDFARELNDLSDPEKMKTDLMAVQMMKACQDSNTIKIERALRESRNG